MKTFSQLLTSTAWLWLLSLSLPAEDTILLKNGDRFTGSLLSISSSKGVEISSPRSPSTISFQSSALESLDLAQSEEAPDFQSEWNEQLTLINGDILPGRIVNLDEQTISFQSFGDRTYEIDRSYLYNLRLGVFPQRLVYQGPLPLSAWIGHESTAWIEQDGQLLMDQRDSLYQDVDLARQFLLRFLISWEDEPDFQIYFCDDGSNEPGSDRYYISLSSGGLQFRRENSDVNSRFVSLASIPGDAEAFDDSAVVIEVRGNRLLNTFQILLDGELMREVEDELPRTTGSGIRIKKLKNTHSFCILEELETYTWDASSSHLKIQEAQAGDTDTLIDIESNRIPGDLQSFSTNNEENIPAFQLQNPYVAETISIPYERASLLQFRLNDNAKDFDSIATIQLIFGGRLSITDLTLQDDRFHFQHPLLGKIALPRTLVKSASAF